MKRYFWERGENSATKFLIFDGVQGSLPGAHIAVCRSSAMAQKLADALNHCEEYWGPKCRVTDTYLGPLTHAILSMHDHRPAIRLRPDGTYERVAYSLWDGVPGEGEV